MVESNFANVHEYTVSELAGAVKRTIEDGFSFVRVRGELGRVTRAGNLLLRGCWVRNRRGRFGSSAGRQHTGEQEGEDGGLCLNRQMGHVSVCSCAGR